MRNFRCFPSLHRDVLAVLVLTCFEVASSAGCGGAGEPESKMTSYSAGQAKEDTAELFTVPQDQMAHVQVAPVQKSRLPRVCI